MTRHLRAVVGAVLLSGCFAFGPELAAAPADREKYAPYPEDGYPQIIQRNDYATIECIEALFRALRPLASGDRASFGATLMCDVSPDALIFRSSQSPDKVTLKVERGEAVAFDSKRFSAQASVVLFRTLLRVVNDLAAVSRRCEVRIAQFGTRAYNKRTIVAFDIGPRVLEIDCLANSRANQERLYVLDLVERDKSFFSQPFNSRSGDARRCQQGDVADAILQARAPFRPITNF
jgi:hypothetical protein